MQYQNAKTSFLIFAGILLALVNSARILVVLPTPSYSHNIVYSTIYKELSLRGHEIVAFTPNPLKDPKLTNVKEIDMSFLYKHTVDTPHEEFFIFHEMSVVVGIKKMLSKITRQVFLHPEMKKLLNDSEERFDLFLVEWDVNPSLSVISKKFDCPMIGMRSLGLQLEGHDNVGNPTNPSYIPVGWTDFDKSFWARLNNFLFEIIWRVHHHLFVVPKAQEIAEEFLPDHSKNILDIEKNVSLVLTNTHPIVTGVRPIVPAVIEIGGIHLKKEKRAIPKDVKRFLNSAKEGVIYFNLGSNVKSSNLRPKTLKAILSAFSELPYKVIWRWDVVDFPNLPKNVKIWDWLPQESILGHPNVKLLITHGGLLSIMEGIDNRVPMVGIPFFADQHMNVRRMVNFKIAKKLDIHNFKKKKFIKIIKEVIKNPSYILNVQKMGYIFNDVPMKPLDKAIWWIEYVLRHKGAQHLRSPAVDLNWFIYLLLDVLTVFIASVLVLLAILNYIIKLLWKMLIPTKPGREKSD